MVFLTRLICLVLLQAARTHSATLVERPPTAVTMNDQEGRRLWVSAPVEKGNGNKGALRLMQLPLGTHLLLCPSLSGGHSVY